MKTLFLAVFLAASLDAKESVNGMQVPDEKIVRTWTSSDGKQLEAELLEYSDKEAKLKNTRNFQIAKVPLERLSGADREFVLEMVRKSSLDFSLTHGKYKDAMLAAFNKMTSAEGLNYQIYGDPRWDGKRRYPLLIWLHGAGQSGTDNESQTAGSPKPLYGKEAQEKHPCFVIMPQCPDRAVGWKGPVAENLIRLVDDLCANLPVDRDRIYLTGSSMGGFGTWGIISQWPDKFAAAVPLCGGGDPAKAALIKHIPIWAFHGDMDQSVSVDNTRRMDAALKAAGGNMKYTELAGAGHLITDQVYKMPELDEWLFQQKRSGE